MPALHGHIGRSGSSRAGTGQLGSCPACSGSPCPHHASTGTCRSPRARAWPPSEAQCCLPALNQLLVRIICLYTRYMRKPCVLQQIFAGPTWLPISLHLRPSCIRRLFAHHGGTEKTLCLPQETEWELCLLPVTWAQTFTNKSVVTMGVCIDCPPVKRPLMTSTVCRGVMSMRKCPRSSITLQQPAARQAWGGSVLYQIDAVDIRSVLDKELHCVEVAVVRASDQGGLLHLWHHSVSSASRCEAERRDEYCSKVVSPAFGLRNRKPAAVLPLIDLRYCQISQALVGGCHMQAPKLILSARADIALPHCAALCRLLP